MCHYHTAYGHDHTHRSPGRRVAPRILENKWELDINKHNNRTLELRSNALTNAEKHIMSNIASARCWRYTKDLVILIGPNDILHYDVISRILLTSLQMDSQTGCQVINSHEAVLNIALPINHVTSSIYFLRQTKINVLCGKFLFNHSQAMSTNIVDVK